MLHSAVIATWMVVGMDTRFLVGRLLMVVPFVASLVVFMGLLRRAPVGMRFAWPSRERGVRHMGERYRTAPTHRLLHLTSLIQPKLERVPTQRRDERVGREYLHERERGVRF